MSSAVFIGSSNAAAGTWPEIFCTRQGLECYNYSVPGGGFTSALPGRFDTQIATAIADSSCDHGAVKFVFIVDAGNDIRATNSVAAGAPGVFAAARAAYPNARVIVIPALWGIAADNAWGGRIASVTQRAQELREAALPFGVEIVDYSWTWHYDDPGWMKPGEVHYTPAGYMRVVQFVEKYLRGESTDSPIGWKFVAARGATDPDTTYLRARREGNNVFLHGPLRLRWNLGIDSDIAQLAPGLAPLETVAVPVVSNDRTLGTVNVFPSGLIRSLGSLQWNYWHFNTVLAAF